MPLSTHFSSACLLWLFLLHCLIFKSVEALPIAPTRIDAHIEQAMNEQYSSWSANTFMRLNNLRVSELTDSYLSLAARATLGSETHNRQRELRDIPKVFGIEATATEEVPSWNIPTRRVGRFALEVAFMIGVLRVGKWADERFRKRNFRGSTIRSPDNTDNSCNL